ncbi:MAG: Bug family tripartite tricarboxylate transporter substrate binding protein [Betaproteobacteria bacterium]|nr:Bug family tripartite tricarboxylate transporter substrate binding protein [Betaproteobacteria bacterium]
MQAFTRTLLTACLAFTAQSAMAQDNSYRILVGFAPGGGADLIARLAADKMRDALGAPVVVENRPGAGGQIAADALRMSKPDGRTLMVAPVAVTVIAPLTYRKISYVPSRDFAPVSLAVNFQLALTVGPASGAKTLPEFVAWLKADARRTSFGVPAVGSLPHFFGLLFGRAIGIDMQHVPYKGGAPLLNDIAGGQVPAGFDVLSEAITLHKAGKVRIVATSGSKRSPIASEIPTFTELGFPQIQGDGFFAFHARAGSPQDTLDRLSAAAAAAIKAPDVSARLLSIGFEPVGSTSAELARRMSEDTAKWGPVVKASGFVAD